MRTLSGCASASDRRREFIKAKKKLSGVVCAGYGVASANLREVMHLIEARMGVRGLLEGTLNLQITEEYIVTPEAVIAVSEYPLNRTSGLEETIKLARCVIAGRKAIIMRPDTHETGLFHGPAHLELMGNVNFRQTLGLNDGSSVIVEVEGDEDWWQKAS
jgi:CTP-dependent riboflavin kinase